MTNNERLQSVLNCLNAAYLADPQAVSALMCNFVPCNKKMVLHPHVIVQENVGLCGMDTVGTLGMINGVLTAAGLPRVTIKWSDKKNLDNRYTFQGFVKAGDSAQPPEHQTRARTKKSTR